MEEDEDIKDYFVPESGNVAFASAHDGWAFRPYQFAELHAAKMGLKPEKLVTILWGSWWYDAKTKRAVKIKQAHSTKQTPLFVQVSAAICTISLSCDRSKACLKFLLLLC